MNLTGVATRPALEPGQARNEIQPPTLTTLPDAVAKNMAIVRSRTRAQVMAVVKADGYGHGDLTLARAAVDAGATWLGTTDLAAAARLRAAGLEVPILSWLNPSGIDAELALDQRIDIAIGSVDELGALCPDPPIHRYYAAPDRRAGGVDNARQASSLPSTLSPCHRTCPVPLATRAIGGSGLGPWQPGQGPVRVHLYLDTGMAREGCQAREWTTLVAQALRAQQRGQITVVGIMGHIPAAQFANPEAHSSAAALIRQANQAASRAGLSIRLTHLAATASALNDPTTHFDLVRVGAGLVGIDPAGLTNLHAACHLRAPVVHTSFVPAGTPVGYGGSYVTPVATNLAVLPVGYADGIPRELSGDAYVEINRRPARIVGRVSMDQIVVDTRSQRVPYATIATVFGPPDGITPTIHDWARWANTIPHTIITGIGSRVRRRHP